MSYKIWKNNTWIECAGQPDLTAFQKKLIAGTGIKIDQETNVISADGLADGNVAYDTETKTLYVKKDGSYLAITDIDLVTQEKERAELAESGKLDLLGDVPGWAPGTNPYKVSYYYEMIPGANGITVKAKTISLDNKKTQGEYSLEVPAATIALAGLMNAHDKELNINVEKILRLDGKHDSEGGINLQIPYKFDVTPNADYLRVHSYTVGLREDGKGIEYHDETSPQQFYIDVPSATTTTAGLMSASDKIKLGNSQTKVVYSSTEPTGAQENDIWIY